MSATLIILVGAIFAIFATRRLEPSEIRYALAAFALHMVSAFGQFGLQEYYYGISDAHAYMDAGALIARFLEYDFVKFAPQVVRLIFHLETDFPEVFGSGASSGTMSGIAAIFVYTFGPSLLCACLATGIVSWFGQLCLYHVAREEFRGDEKRAALFGCLFVPSAVFWGSGFAKEALAMGAFGVLVWASHQLLKKRNFTAIAAMASGAVGVAVLKPYILFPYFIAVAAWIYVDRAWSGEGTPRVRPLYLILAAIFAIGGVALMGAIFPEFGVDRVAETVARQQGLWQQTDGGSNTDMGSEDARTFYQQLPYVPIALANALFRPLVFETRNAPTLVAALEMTVISAGMVSLLFRGSLRSGQLAIMRSPPLVFSLVFVLFFAVAVGLATSNLGSLSRYRVPMMPFYATALLVLHRRARVAHRPSAFAAERS